MTPRHPVPEPMPRLSRRAIALGSVGVLAGAVVMGALGFTAPRPAHVAPITAVVSPSPYVGGQLQTLSLTDLRGHQPLGRR
ncbi:hypothetical protein GCM10009840_08710 [Pseudolysinimonas kribbensis]|uniref:hypothetical protein n=1 Tax=Pseudolysinimonas kribbensis TaxID=433641 RepID=UPI0031DF85AD